MSRSLRRVTPYTRWSSRPTSSISGAWSGHRYALIFPWFAVHERRLQAYRQANGWPVLASLISCFNPYARLPGGRPSQAIEDTFAATWPDTSGTRWSARPRGGSTSTWNASR